MKSAINLMKTIFTMKFPWNLWVAVMAIANMALGILYFSMPEGKLTLAALMGSFVVMTVIFSKFGFVRLLGLGHVLFWTPLCIWLLTRLQDGQYDLAVGLKTWVYCVLVVNILSLLIDYADVIRYLRGERSAL